MSRLGDVLVLGLGRSGLAAARTLLALGEPEVTSVTAVDAAGDDRVCKAAHELERLGARVVLGVQAVPGSYDTCVASPGIAPRSPLMQSAAGACDRLMSEIELAFLQSCAPWVAITGTNGKTTTTSLVSHLLSGAGQSVFTVGNIGRPAIEVAASVAPDDVLVAEVSSFQLALTEAFHPRVAVLLNITPDHVDWHGSLERYAEDKARVFANLTADDTAVIDVDDAAAAPWAERLEERGVRVARVSRTGAVGLGAMLDEGVLVLRTAHGSVPLVDAEALRIRGDHNISNALAAAAAAFAMGAHPDDVRAGLLSFAPIEHRLEPVGEIDGVEYVNDSKATNPDAVMKALTAFGERRLIVMLGGRNKGSDFVELGRAIVTRGDVEVIVFGEAADEIADGLARAGVGHRRSSGFTEAFAAARGIAARGDVVLLSPGCASFDEFTSYEHRGDTFRDMVASAAS